MLLQEMRISLILVVKKKMLPSFVLLLDSRRSPKVFATLFLAGKVVLI